MVKLLVVMREAGQVLVHYLLRKDHGATHDRHAIRVLPVDRRAPEAQRYRHFKPVAPLPFAAD